MQVLRQGQRSSIESSSQVHPNPNDSPMISSSMAFLDGTRVNASPMRSSDLAAIGRPASAALIVAGLSRDSRARSDADQPLRTISNRSRPACTMTLIGPLHREVRTEFVPPH